MECDGGDLLYKGVVNVWEELNVMKVMCRVDA